MTSEFFGPDNVELDSNVVIFGQRNEKLGRIQCTLAAILLLVTFQDDLFFYFVTSEFLGPDNVKLDSNIVIFGLLIAKFGRIQCMSVAMLLWVTL